MSLTPDDPRHGTTNGYGNLGCRCERCREANKLRMRDYYERHPEQREKKRQRELQRYERYLQGDYVPPRGSWHGAQRAGRGAAV